MSTKPTFNLKTVTSSYNHRFPLNPKLRELGYGIFKDDVPAGSEKMPLWEMATSDDPVRKAEFIQLIEQYEGDSSDGDDEIENTGQNGSLKALATNMYAIGQLEPIGVRANGGKEKTFQLVFGHRRSLAWLFLYCQGIVKQPLAWAEEVKGNHATLQTMALAENVFRKGLTRMERAKAYAEQINGGAKYEDIAQREGVDQGTIRNFVKLTELPEAFYAAVDSKALPMGVALTALNNVKSSATGLAGTPIEQAKAISEEIKKITTSKSSGGGGGGGGGGGTRKMRPRKEVEARFAAAKSKYERSALAWVLMMEDSIASNDLLPDDK